MPRPLAHIPTFSEDEGETGGEPGKHRDVKRIDAGKLILDGKRGAQSAAQNHSSDSDGGTGVVGAVNGNGRL